MTYSECPGEDKDDETQSGSPRRGAAVINENGCHFHLIQPTAWNGGDETWKLFRLLHSLAVLIFELEKRHFQIAF